MRGGGEGHPVGFSASMCRQSTPCTIDRHYHHCTTHLCPNLICTDDLHRGPTSTVEKCTFSEMTQTFQKPRMGSLLGLSPKPTFPCRTRGVAAIALRFIASDSCIRRGTDGYSKRHCT